MIDRFRFRAWYYDKDDENDSDNNKMFYNAQDTYDCLGGNPPLKASSFGDIIDDERWVIEQCTGLKDKNGNLIYEGDIVKSGKHIYPVEWYVNGFAVNDGYDYLVDNGEWEVIGNIHENTDLLEI
jgi:uncharacterized phage protein (TIGR01671 family)